MVVVVVVIFFFFLIWDYIAYMVTLDKNNVILDCSHVTFDSNLHLFIALFHILFYFLFLKIPFILALDSNNHAYQD